MEDRPGRMRESPPLLVVENLKTHFFTRRGITKAVDGVSFTLHAGETLALVGESGSGKSVTCLSLVRLVPEPAGRIVAAGCCSRETICCARARPRCAASGASRSRWCCKTR
jgi:ABC-type dipeptide/oligopeptide/nickel transport system ATPase component